MARYFKLIIVMLIAVMASCQEGREAGDLLGQWRMNGSDTHYISFSGSVVLFRCIGKGEVYGNFRHSGDSLFIDCHSIYGYPADTLLVESTFGMRPFENIRLRIDALDDDRLVLSQGERKWGLDRY